jgi:hypothetical protein
MANDPFQQFRDKLDAEKKRWGGPEGKGGAPVLGTINGPPSFKLVEILLQIAEDQEKRIAALEARMRS